ncbi:Uncharacterised protein [Shigella flexneri]|nr:Uncharacterised protein [Shigella flexneri]
MSVPEQIKKISFLPLPLWTNLLRNRNSRWPLRVGIHSSTSYALPLRKNTRLLRLDAAASRRLINSLNTLCPMTSCSFNPV